MAETALEKKIKKAKQEVDALLGLTSTPATVKAYKAAKQKLDKLISASGGIENVNKLIAGIEKTNTRLNESIAKGTVKGQSVVASTRQTIEQNKARIEVLRSVGQQFADTPDQQIVTPTISTARPEDVETPGQVKQGPPMGPYSPAMIKAAKDYVDKGLSGPLNPTTAYLVQEYIASKKPGGESTIFNASEQEVSTGTSRRAKDFGNKKPATAVSGDTYTNSKNVKFTYQNGKWVRTATLRTTGTGVGTPSETVVVEGKKVVVGSEQWKTIVQQEFGSMWDVYNSDPEVKKVIDESVRLGYFDDETKMTAKLQNTTWFRTTQQSARQFAIQQSTDPATTEARVVSTIEEMRTNAGALGFTLNDASLRKLATDSLKFGWSDQQKLNALGSEQVAQAQLGGPQGMANLRQSSVGRNLRAKAAAYFQKPSEELIGTWTQQILTGQKSEVQFDELMRNSARTQFRSLQPALDRGEDVDTAMYAYKQQAEAVLGSSIDASQIDWTQDKWNKALNFRDEKTNEFRQMDLWEWNKYLRSLPEWQNTDEAKIAYDNLAQSLARGFGKTA
jgi:hypothetical protein